jgi:hypothetical protein
MENKINFTIHYHLMQEDLHIMQEDLHNLNALIHNECERNFILSVKNLEKYAECEFDIEVLPKKEGGLISEYIIEILKDVGPFAGGILTAWVTNFFRPKTHTTEEIKDKAEIIDKIKQGNYTQEEFDYIASSDKDLMRLKSNFYKSASKEPSIVKIETQISDNQPIYINHNEFHINIITPTEETTKKDILNVTIYIVSPILVKIPNSKQKWRGIYQGYPIDFNILDKEFIKQVENHEIYFENGTNIVCNLVIITKTKCDESGEENKEYFYSVKDVLQWEDDKHFLYETKKYKKIKQDKRELSLFSDKDFE